MGINRGGGYHQKKLKARIGVAVLTRAESSWDQGRLLHRRLVFFWRKTTGHSLAGADTQTQLVEVGQDQTTCPGEWGTGPPVSPWTQRQPSGGKS